MLITAEDLERWADQPAARTELPDLVRRLICSTGGRVRRLAMPSGSGTDLPGSDGIVEASEGDAWVPGGLSRWELSCEKQVRRKADADLKTRSRTTGPLDRANTTFVFLTPRRWSDKDRWLASAKGSGWREVRALDAHDLVQWLEAAPAVALWLAEKLGKAGPGVESPERFFARWSRGSDPAITAQALAVGRAGVPRALKEAASRHIEEQKQRAPEREPALPPLTLRADSEEEAAAFAAAVLQRNPRLAAGTLVVTDRQGWHWVARNPDIRIVLCATGALAKEREPRKDLVVLIPHAQGDVSPFEGEASRSPGPEIRMPRPRPEQFAAALKRLGFDKERAWALAGRCGRSWSVFRRLHAAYPAFGGAPWLDRPEARSLVPLTLLDAWKDQEGDRAVVAEIAGRPYEDVERELRVLADLPDAPVLDLKGVWKAKAPAELLRLVAPKVTRSEVDRFLAAAKRVLEARDPALDLPPEKRWVAAVHGKTRAHSAELCRGLADTLAALAVEGSTVLRAERTIDGRIEGLVAELLDGADAERWLSLSDPLPSLAEAAPRAFLNAVERSLRAPDQPIAALFHESVGGWTGRCWFAPLLWALELLAWEPAHLLRVSEILCRLQAIPRNDSFGNGPNHSLSRLFRPRHPQTGATLEQRLEALDQLARDHPQITFDVLLGMLRGYDDALQHARPAWRDGWLRPVRVTVAEWRRACAWAADRAVALAEGNAGRLVRVIQNLDAFRVAEREDAALKALDRFARTHPPDEDRERLRAALRDRISLDELRSKKPFPHLPSALPLARLYRRLAPSDPVLRSHWLFDALFPDFPGHFSKLDVRERVLGRWRVLAIRDLLGRERLAGLFRLAEASKFPELVGAAVACVGVDLRRLVEEAVARNALAKGLDGPIPTMVLAAVHAAPPEAKRAALEALLRHLGEAGRPPEDLARALGPCVDARDLRDLVEAQPEEVRRAIRMLRPRDVEDVRALLDAGRPLAALQVLVYEIVPCDPAVLFEALEAVVRNDPEAGADTSLLGDSLIEAVERLEKADAIDRGRLAGLELALLPVLQPLGAAPGARALFQAMTTDPEWFVGLLKMLFPAQGEPRPAPDAQAEARADLAWRAFQWCTSLPGQRDDGSVDGEALNAFVGRARELAREAGRLDACDRTLGCILAHAPEESDGRWPCAPVAALLDRLDQEDLWTGFFCGTWNKRGVVSRSPHEGGEQERRLAERYRRFAQGWSQRHPRTAACLDRIAKAYEQQGRCEDAAARLRMEDLP